MDNSVISLNDIVKAVEPLREKYKIDAVYVFGSYARNEATAESDVDFLVEFAENPTSLIHICGLRETLSELLKSDVDIVKLPRKPDDGLHINRTMCLYESL